MAELDYEINIVAQSNPNDGEQVEPAPVEPEKVRVREAREVDGELACE